MYAFGHFAPTMSLLLQERRGGWREVLPPIGLSTVMCDGVRGACCPPAGTGLWSQLGSDMGARQALGGSLVLAALESARSRVGAAVRCGRVGWGSVLVSQEGCVSTGADLWSPSWPSPPRGTLICRVGYTVPLHRVDSSPFVGCRLVPLLMS